MTSQRLSIHLMLHLLPFSPNSNVKLWPPRPNSTPRLGVRVDLGALGRKWYQSKSHPHIPIQRLYTLYAYLAPFGHNIQRGRQIDIDDIQSDRNRRKQLGGNLVGQSAVYTQTRASIDVVVNHYAASMAPKGNSCVAWHLPCKHLFSIAHRFGATGWNMLQWPPDITIRRLASPKK